VLVDADHILWAIALDRKLALRYITSVDLKGFYLEFVRREGRFYQYIVKIRYEDGHHGIFFYFHAGWLFAIGLALYIILHEHTILSVASDYFPLFWLILIMHLIMDLIYWW
jgi:hypothetical protein